MLTILQGDAIEQLRTLPDESVQCCVTSPPYWGLRDYGTAEWEGGEAECDHLRPATKPRGERPNHSGCKIGEGGPTWDAQEHASRIFNESCGKCGAKRIDSQLGLEKTPEEYVAKMVEVFREVRRVLRKDGTLWCNMGDGYNSPNTHTGKADKVDWGIQRVLDAKANAWIGNKNLKPKDLLGMPWRLAFALQADGWWLRSDIIWAKPNPMPESVTDRPTKSHEYIFLLTKSANYFYDAEAIKERSGDWHESIPGREDGPGQDRRQKVRSPAGWATHNGSHGSIHRNGREQEITYNEIPNSRNKRSVWTVATAPYPEAHFATYPPDLIKPCIMAGSKNGDVVLDPFAGSGTTGMVALEFGRKAVLIELNPAYVKLIEQRCNVTMGLALA